MTTNHFIAALRRAPENLLLFVDSKGNVVHRGTT
jgi:hypothetical protein